MNRVFVLDDHGLVRSGLCALLEREPNTQVVGQAESFEELRRWLRDGGTPDVLTLDLEVPGEEGRAAVLEILRQRPDLQVLIVSHRVLSDELRQLVKAGIRGYVTKAAPAAELLMAVRAVSRGKSYFCSEAASALTNSLRNGEGEGVLTERQLDVLTRVARGQTTSEVAEAMHLSPKTVEKYRSSILKRLEARNIVEAVEIARRRKLLPD